MSGMSELWQEEQEKEALRQRIRMLEGQMMTTFIVVHGDKDTGYHHTGPFATYEEALNWGIAQEYDFDWGIIELYPPSRRKLQPRTIGQILGDE